MGRLFPLLPLLLWYGVAAAAQWTLETRVSLVHGELEIDHGKSVAEISKAQASGGFPGDHGVGLFQNRVRYELNLESPQPGLGGKSLLLNVNISTRPIIYIAREYPRDSCAYGVILHHELTHQLYDLEVLRQMPDEARRIARETFNPDGLDWLLAGQAVEAQKKRYFQRLNHLYESHSAHRHQRIDSPESYRALSRSCAGELGRILEKEKN